jgi:hypothetical protein
MVATTDDNFMYRFTVFARERSGEVSLIAVMS